METKEMRVSADSEVTLTIEVRVPLNDSEIADLMGCEIEDLIHKSREEIKEKLEEYASYNWDEYTYTSEIIDTDVDLTIEVEEDEENNQIRRQEVRS